MRSLREAYVHLINIGIRKSQDILSKWGSWEPWEMVEGETREREGSRKNCIYILKIRKKEKKELHW